MSTVPLAAVAIASWPLSRSLVTVFALISPVPPITTILTSTPVLSTARRAIPAKQSGRGAALRKAQTARPRYASSTAHRCATQSKSDEFGRPPRLAVLGRANRGAHARRRGGIRCRRLGTHDMRDGRCLTLEDTVEFLNLVLWLSLNKEEKPDLVAFMGTY